MKIFTILTLAESPILLACKASSKLLILVKALTKPEKVAPPIPLPETLSKVCSSLTCKTLTPLPTLTNKYGKIDFLSAS